MTSPDHKDVFSQLLPEDQMGKARDQKIAHSLHEQKKHEPAERLPLKMDIINDQERTGKISQIAFEHQFQLIPDQKRALAVASRQMHDDKIKDEQLDLEDRSKRKNEQQGCRHDPFDYIFIYT